MLFWLSFQTLRASLLDVHSAAGTGIAGTIRSWASLSYLYFCPFGGVALEPSAAKLPVSTGSDVHCKLGFNVSGFSVDVISPGAFSGCSGAGELNTKCVLDDPEASRTEFKPMQLEKNPHAQLNAFLTNLTWKCMFWVLLSKSQKCPCHLEQIRAERIIAL